jgi:asparagine synthetase B (glutamine-hydrolysing)
MAFTNMNFINTDTNETSQNINDLLDGNSKFDKNCVLDNRPLFRGATPYSNIKYDIVQEDICDIRGETLREMIENYIGDIKKIYDGKTAVLLSGGTDSSIISSMWKPSEVWTINTDWNEKQNENHFAELMAKKINSKVNYINLFFDEQYYIDLIKEHAVPSRHTGLFAMEQVVKRLKEEGYEYIVNGAGAEACFGMFDIGFVVDLFDFIENNSSYNRYMPRIIKALGTPEELLIKLQGIEDDIDYSHIEETKRVERLHVLSKDLSTVILYNEHFLSLKYGIKFIYPFRHTKISEYAYSYDKRKDYKHEKYRLVLKEQFKDVVPLDILNRKYKMGYSIPYWEWFPGVEVGNYKQLINKILYWFEK